ncbi:hypothetical protein ABNX05_11340 [Lysinibacillus sp. M3]|uniref:DUF2188 domain-containing protein n=1 Tax=Lysinibacillus zambalensis TaxID=3160866 RepID=A0ABV1MRS9_9BACI
MYIIKIGNQWVTKLTTGSSINDSRKPTLFETKESAEHYASLNLPKEDYEITEYEELQKKSN